MKKNYLNRFFALILVLAMVLSMAPSTLAIPLADIRWRETDQQVSIDRSDRLADMALEEKFQPTDLVRVSIVLEEKSTIQAGFSTMNLASNAEAMAYNKNLQKKQETVQQAISRKVLGGEKLDVVWNLTLVGNIISANVPYGKIELIRQVDGVAGVVLENTYEPYKNQAENDIVTNMTVSSDMIGSGQVWTNGYTGAGSRVAVIDTGTDTDHQSFDNGAFLYALEQNALASGVSFEEYVASLDLLDAEEIASVLPELNIFERDSSLTADALYLNEKLAFAVNYVDDGDYRLNVDHDDDYQGDHGSHVAGIATANRYIPSGDGYVDALENVMVAGVAPDAQLITMKVFGIESLTDADYMAAIEDAILLGCDSVNLSLGTVVSGFAFNSYYEQLLSFMAETDTVVVTSAGNAGMWTDMTIFGTPYSDDVNFDALGAPGSYSNFFTVASVENDGAVGMVFTVGDLNVMYTEMVGYGNEPLASIDTTPDGAGTAYEYVFIDGIGLESDYQDLDLTGKVVFCSRGETNFADKANIAVSLGAVAVVIYNNQSGGFGMNLSGYSYTAPAVSISQEEADYIRGISSVQTAPNGTAYYTGTIDIFASPKAGKFHSEYYTMSSYSSWGVPGDLSIKPEITAPGGMIYSIYGSTPETVGTDQYGLMSGTSMAAPQVAGMVALVAQYLRESGLDQQVGLSPRVLAQSLLMSTAVPMLESPGNYYSILNQGSGLARVDLATLAESFIMVSGQDDGKVKAELGDDPERTGVYTFSFVLNNLTGESQDYALSADLFRQGVYDPGEAYYGEPYGFTVLDTATVLLSSTASFLVDGNQVVNNQMPDCDWNGDGVTDELDADYLLEYLLGNETQLYADGDVSGDGVVSTYDAHYLLAQLYSGHVITVPADGSVTVEVTLTLNEIARAQLDAENVDGAYIQGYVFAEQVTEDPATATNHSIPVLAFYGNWTDPNMFDRGTYVEMMYGISDMIPYLYQIIGNGNALTVNYGDGNEYYFGGNPLLTDNEYLPQRNAFNSQDESFLQAQYFTLLRNAGDSRLQIVDKETGEVYYSQNYGELYPAFYNISYSYWDYTQLNANIYWSGTDMNGEPLPEGTVIEVIFTALPEYYRNEDGTYNYDAAGYGASLVTEMTIDNTAPTVSDMNLAAQERRLSVTAQDNQYISAVVLMNKTGTVLLSAATPNQTTADTEMTIDLDLSGVTGSTFLLALYDYACNVTTYEIELELPEIERPHFTVVDYGTGTYYGIGADGTTVTLGVSDRGMIMAAEFVDGYVFEVSNGSKLHVAQDNDLNSFQYLCDLDPYGQWGITSFLDLAYNYADGQLYGLFYSELNGEWYPYLCTIDMFSGAMEVLLEMPTDVNNMTIDDEGNFYSVTYGYPSLYTYTLEGVSNGQMTYVGEISYYGTDSFNSLAWDHDADKLYWAYPNTLLEVNPETAEPTLLSYFMFSMVGLYIRPEHYEGTLFAPVDEVREVTLDYSENRVMLGSKVLLTASVSPWNITDDSVTWTSDNESVATVDETGMVTGLSLGTAVITATSTLDPTKSASCVVEVFQLEKTLNGLIWDQVGEIWWSEFSINGLPNYIKLQDTPVEEYLASTAFTPDGTLYAATTDVSSGYLSSSLFTVDPETFAITKVGDSEYGYSDIAYAPNLRGGAIMGTYGSYLMVIDPATGELMGENSYYQMFMYGLCAIAYAGSERYQDWGFDTYIDWFFLIDTQGFVYLMGFLADDYGNLYYLEHPATSGGIFCVVDYTTEVIYFSSAHYDGDFLYWSVYNEKADMSTLFAIDTVGSRKAYNLGNFGDGVWPAGGLMELDNPSAGMGLNSYEQMPQPKSVTDGELEKLSVSAPVVNAASVAGDPADENRITLAITPADLATNGTATVTFDPAALALVEVIGLTQAFAYTTADGTVNLAYAEANALSDDTVLATLVFDVLATGDHTVTVTHGELNNGEADLTEELAFHIHEAAIIPGWEATCAEPGMTEGAQCIHCGELLVWPEEIPATGHSYVDGSCQHCGEKDPDAVLLGDANDDGEINYLDAMLIAQYYVGDIADEDLNLSAADVNGDGEVNYLDAMMVAQYYVGDIDSFSQET